jgi:hypothetical protein
MRVAVSSLVLVVAAVAASPDARAEVASLGGVALGQEMARAGTIKTTVYGCAGRLYPDIDRKKKVIKVRFESDKCADVAAAVAAITKEFGQAPIVSAEGDKLWEGKRASLILSPSLSNYPTSPVLLLVPPGPGSKRACWADDGFAAFWKAFVKSVVAGKPAAVATSFAFPLKDQDEKVKFKDAAAFAARWRELIDESDAKEVDAGELTPMCRLDQETYRLQLPGSYSDITATKVRGAWKWTVMGEVSPD